MKAPGPMDETQVKAIVKEAVKETLISLGIEACDPMEMQADFHYLRNLRETSRKVSNKLLLTLTGVLAVIAISAVTLGIKAVITGG